MKTTVTFTLSGEFSPHELFATLGISKEGADILCCGDTARITYKKSFLHTESADECISDMLYETLLPLLPAEDRLGELKEELRIRYYLDIDTIPKDSLLILDGKICGFFPRSGAIRDIDYHVF